MTIHYQGHGVTLHHGDCLDVLRTLPDASVDSVVTDPPYGLEFMGKDWDRFDGGQQARWEGRKTTAERMDRDGMGAEGMADRLAARPSFGKDSRGRKCIKCGHYKFSGTPCRCAEPEWGIRTGTPPHMRAFQQWCELWATECLRVLKPGGHMLAFGGTRTWHRLACAVEDAGFEVRDSIAWLYGSGFPKSLDVSKAIDKAAGVTGERGPMKRGGERLARLEGGARDGGGTWGDEVGRDAFTYLPGSEAARQWAGFGTALKPAFEPVVVARKPLSGTVAATVLAHGTGALNIDGCRIETSDDLNGGGYSGGTPKTMFSGLGRKQPDEFVQPSGRWPANVVLDESQAEALDEQSGTSKDGVAVRRNADGGRKSARVYGDYANPPGEDVGYGGQGGASRFFPTFRYEAKAPASERPRHNGTAHPTVKPLALMRWLVRLVTPPGGTVLEPFAGSGTTVEACIIEGFDCIAIEKGDEYLPLIMQRIHRRRDPVAAIRQTGDELGLFELDGEGA